MEKNKQKVLWSQCCKQQLFLLLVLSLINTIPLGAQCFSSSGNPVGGSQNMGTLNKRVLSCLAFHKTSYSDRYFEGDQISEVDILKNANFNYSGFVVAYGLTRKLTVEAEAGFFINKTKNYNIPAGYSLKGFGPSTLLLSAKVPLIINYEKGFSWAASAGLKTPFKRELQYIDNVRLPFDLQPSTGAFGLAVQSFIMKQNSFTGMRYFLFNRMDLNGTSMDGYHYGASFVNAVFISKHLIKTSSWPVSITMILQLKNEIYRQNSLWDEPEISSGAVKIFAVPQLNFSFHEIWNLSISTDLPLYQNYNHIQLANRMALSLSLSRAFEFY